MAKKKTTKLHNDIWQYVLSCRQLNDLKFNFQQEIGKFEADFICKDKKLIVQFSSVALTTKMQKTFEKAGYKTVLICDADIDDEYKKIKELILNAVN